MIHLARDAYESTGSRNLCLAGGVALNCVANQKLVDVTPFRRVYVQPAAADNGIAIGNACYYYLRLEGNPQDFKPMRSAALGHSYNDREIKELLSFYQKGRLVVNCFEGFPKDFSVVCKALTTSADGSQTRYQEERLTPNDQKGRFF
jgi:carbamoyltransferase